MSEIKQTDHRDTVTRVSDRYEALLRDFGILRQLEDFARGEYRADDLLKYAAGLIAGEGLAEHCSFMLLDPAGAYLELRAVGTRYASRGFSVGSDIWRGKRFATGEGVAGRVASSGVPIRIDDARAEPTFLPLPDSTVEIRALMCFPLVYREEMLGVLNLSHGEPGFFDIEREKAMAVITMRLGSLLGACPGRDRAPAPEEPADEAGDHAGGILLVRDTAGRTLGIAAHCEALTGAPAPAWISGELDWRAHVNPADRGAYDGYLARLAGGAAGGGIEYSFTTKRGARRRFHETAISVEAMPGGGIVSWVQHAAAREVLCRCFSESAASGLLHAQRVHTVGALANGVIHDLNNLLTGVVGNLDLALCTDSPDRVGNLVTRARTASVRGAEIVNKVLKFGQAGRAGDGHEPLDVRRLLVESASILDCTLDPKIRLDVNAPPEPGRVCGDERQLIQALVNLGMNARDSLALREPGDSGPDRFIRLGAELVHLDDRVRGPWDDGVEGDFIRFYITDNGSGMTPEVVARMYEPFFSTRNAGQGTGLGLPTVKRIVEGHRGWIDVHSTPGKGTTFEFYLPAIPVARPKNEPMERQAPARAAGGACVLVVDDEPLVRNLGLAILRRLGYRTLAAAGGREALDIYKKNAGDIHVVLLDLQMPDMGGEAVLMALRAQSPDLPIIYSTGLCEAETLSWPEEQRPTAFLNKPYLIETMEQVIRQALESRAGQVS